MHLFFYQVFFFYLIPEKNKRNLPAHCRLRILPNTWKVYGFLQIKIENYREQIFAKKKNKERPTRLHIVHALHMVHQRAGVGDGNVASVGVEGEHEYEGRQLAHGGPRLFQPTGLLCTAAQTLGSQSCSKIFHIGIIHFENL